MQQVILDFPKQLKIGLERAKNAKVDDSFDSIVICGVGGSALPGSLLLDYIDNLKIPVYIHRNYGLPSQTSQKSLIVCVSFSGNTEETISSYEQALKMGLKPIAITTGGKLKEMAENHNLPSAIVPNDCLQPRMGVGYQFSALLAVLANCGVIEDKSKEILQTSESLNPAAIEEKGKELAKKLVDKIPIVYGSNEFKSVARIFKIKFNENSKIMAFWNYFPELNHNEMVGLTNLKGKFHFIILKDPDGHERNIKRMELFSQLAEEYGAEAETIEMQGRNKLEKIFNTLILGDFASYYLALEYRIDPMPVKIVEEFKKRLSE